MAFANVPKLIPDLKLLLYEPDAVEARSRSIHNAEIAVFDDIGGKSTTAWNRSDVLLPLTDARMEKRRLTIFMSDYFMEESKQRLCVAAGKSSEPVVAERLLEYTRALSCGILIEGETRRK